MAQIPELQKFREKYPQYNDIDDTTLANKLSQKYPQYNDLVDKVSTSIVSEPKQSFLQKAGDVGKTIVREATRPVVTSLVRPYQLGVTAFGKEGKPPTVNLPFYGDIPPATSTTENRWLPKTSEAKGIFGGGLKTISLGLNPALGGASFMTGQALEENRPIRELPVYAAGGAIAGKVGEKAIQYGGQGLLKGGKLALKGVSKTVTEPVKFIRNSMQNIKNIKNPTKFAKEVRGALFETHRAVGDTFEEGVKTLSANNPARIDLSPQMQYVKSSIDDAVNNPGLASEIKSVIRRIKDPEKVKLLNDIINDPTKASNLTLQQAQDIKVAIQNAPSISAKLKQGKFADWKSGELELLDLLDEIRLAQSEAFPEMATIRAPYAEHMTNYRQVKNMFKPQSLLNKMRTGFGNEEIEASIKAVLPEKTTQAIKGFKKTSATRRGLLKLGGAVLGLEAIKRFVVNPLLGNQRTP